MPHQGEIVLVPVPFTDLSLSSQKRRPVIVISGDAYWLVVGLLLMSVGLSALEYGRSH